MYTYIFYLFCCVTQEHFQFDSFRFIGFYFFPLSINAQFFKSKMKFLPQTIVRNAETK